MSDFTDRAGFRPYSSAGIKTYLQIDMYSREYLHDEIVMFILSRLAHRYDIQYTTKDDIRGD